ncbi:hypothetical protein DA01_07750 [Dehalococcoides mccartyi]|uniref:PA14 domain-containing protein n=1 Tax=Dehalococcoides mccartyi TaxID=61435 RepID=A0A0V8M0F7_9CHLR|nr:hypothetical protein [Dehalococcoides mccartyi]KSV17259.1 hypothetical protein DA01_07750 [Dehalococcoides mccartyi]
MKKIIAASMFIMSLLIGPGTILASDIADAIYRADIRATNTSYTAMKVSVPFTWSAQSLLDGYYIDSGFTNLALRDSNGQDITFMPGWDTNPWMFYINQISQNASLNYNLYTGGETSMNGKLAYFPDTAGMTVADAASLEPGNNFEIELSGYFESGNIWNKSQVFGVLNDASGLSVFGSSAITYQYTSGTGAIETVLTNNWEGQTFTATSTNYVSGVDLYGAKYGNPTGNSYIALYATSAGFPIGSPLAVTTFVTSTWTSSLEFRHYDFNAPAVLTNGEKYALVLYVDNGDSSNNIRWYKDDTSPTFADGNRVYSTNSGSSWTNVSGEDFGFKIYTNPIICSYSQLTGEHTIKVTLTAGNSYLYVDGVLADSAAFAGSITDNANGWVIGAGGSMPYLYYAKITVGGVLKGSWEWQYAATFSDLSGNGNDATPSFRTTTTDADVSAAIISYNAYNLSAFVVSDDDDGVQFVDEEDIPDMPSGFFATLDPDRLEFLSPINEIITEAGIPLEFIWYPVIFGGGAAITMISFGLTRKLLPCIIAGGIWTGFLSAALGADLWTVLPFAVVAVTELTNRKTVSL